MLGQMGDKVSGGVLAAPDLLLMVVVLSELQWDHGGLGLDP